MAKPREAQPRHGGPGESLIDVTTHLGSTNLGSELRKIKGLAPLQKLLMGASSSLQTAVYQVVDDLNHATEVRDLDALATSGDQLFGVMLDVLNTGPRQRDADIRAMESVWNGLQHNIAEFGSGNVRYLQSAQLTLMQVVADRITPVEKEVPGDAPGAAPKKVKQLPGDLSEVQSEYCVTAFAHLLTDNPIARELERIVDANGTKLSAIQKPLWQAETDMIAGISPTIIGYWLSTHSRGQSPALRAIVETAFSISQAHRLANTEEGREQAAAAQGVLSFIMGVESAVEDISRNKTEKEATEELRRYLLRLNMNLSRDGVTGMAVSAEHNPRMIESGAVTEATKVLRDGEVYWDPQEVAQNGQGERKAGRSSMRSTLDIGPVVQLPPQSLLGEAIARAYTGPLAEYGPNERVNKVTWQSLSFPKLRDHFVRSVDKTGKRLLEVQPADGTATDGKDAETRTMTAFEKRLEKAMANEAKTLGNLVLSCQPDNGAAAEGTVLTRNERLAVMWNLWSQVLAERPGENDIVKDQARHLYINTLLNLYQNIDELPPVMQESVMHSMRTIGLTWPARAVKVLGERYAISSVNDVNRHGNIVEFATALGVLEPGDVFDPDGLIQVGGFADGQPLLVTRSANLMASNLIDIVRHWDRLHPRSQGNHTMIAEVSRLHARQLIVRMSEDLLVHPDNVTMHNVVEALSFLYRSADADTKRHLDALRMKYALPAGADEAEIVRFGATPIFKPADAKPNRAFIVNAEDVRQVTALVELLNAGSPGLLEGTVMVIKRLGTDDQVQSYCSIIGAKLSKELEMCLRTDKDAPAPLTHLFNAVDQRLAGIQQSIAAATTQILDQATLRAYFQDDLTAGMLKRLGEDTVLGSQLRKARAGAEEERRALITVLENFRQDTILPLDEATSRRQQTAVALVQSMYDKLMERFIGLGSVVSVTQTLGSLPAGTAKKDEGEAQIVTPALTQVAGMIGTLAGGYALGKGEQAGPLAGSLGVPTADAVMNSAAQFNAVDARGYNENMGEYFKEQRAALSAVTSARIAYIDALMREVSETEGAVLRQQLTQLRDRTQRQFDQLNRVMTSLNTSLERILVMRQEVIAHRVEETQEIMDWVNRFRKVLFGQIFNFRRGFAHGYGIEIPVDLPPVETFIGEDMEFSQRSKQLPGGNGREDSHTLPDSPMITAN